MFIQQQIIMLIFFQVNFRDGSTNYDATKTTTIFRAYHFEGDVEAQV